MSRRPTASLALPADAGNARNQGDAARDAGKIGRALALEPIDMAGEDRLAAERIALEADLDGQLPLLDHRLGLGGEPIDEGLALAERPMPDPAGEQSDREADQEFESGRH